jgi:hypothetical protein
LASLRRARPPGRSWPANPCPGGGDHYEFVGGRVGKEVLLVEQTVLVQGGSAKHAHRRRPTRRGAGAQKKVRALTPVSRTRFTHAPLGKVLATNFRERQFFAILHKNGARAEQRAPRHVPGDPLREVEAVGSGRIATSRTNACYRSQLGPHKVSRGCILLSGARTDDFRFRVGFACLTLSIQ